MPRRSKLKLPPLKLATEESFGQRLSRLRKEKGMTQVELAKATGLQQGLITNYECDRLRMHAEMVIRFAMALGVQTDELLGMPRAKAAARGQPGRLSLKLVRRLHRIETLPGTQQQTLLRTIDVFLRVADQARGHG